MLPLGQKKAYGASSCGSHENDGSSWGTGRTPFLSVPGVLEPYMRRLGKGGRRRADPGLLDNVSIGVTINCGCPAYGQG